MDFKYSSPMHSIGERFDSHTAYTCFRPECAKDYILLVITLFSFATILNINCKPHLAILVE